MSSAKFAATATRTHNYKAHFTRARRKYDSAIEQQTELQAAAAKVIAKQQKLQEEIDFLLDSIHDVDEKLKHENLTFSPLPVCSAEPVAHVEPKTRKRRVSMAATEYSDDDDDDDRSERRVENGEKKTNVNVDGTVIESRLNNNAHGQSDTHRQDQRTFSDVQDAGDNTDDENSDALPLATNLTSKRSRAPDSLGRQRSSSRPAVRLSSSPTSSTLSSKRPRGRVSSSSSAHVSGISSTSPVDQEDLHSSSKRPRLS